MARDCIFYSESSDMGATIPFCNFKNTSDWIYCKHYDPRRGSTQELCPHYISRKDGLEILRRTRSGMKFYCCEEIKDWPDEEAEATISEEARKFINELMSINDTLRRELIMSDAIRSIGKEGKT